MKRITVRAERRKLLLVQGQVDEPGNGLFQGSWLVSARLPAWDSVRVREPIRM